MRNLQHFDELAPEGICAEDAGADVRRAGGQQAEGAQDLGRGGADGGVSARGGGEGVCRAAWGPPGRALASYVAQRCTALTLRELGEAAGGMDYAAVSMAVKRLQERLGRDKALRRMAERLLEENGVK